MSHALDPPPLSHKCPTFSDPPPPLERDVLYGRPHSGLINGRDYSTVDGRSKWKCYWTRASCDCGRLQIGDVTREVEFLSNDYTNPNTNPKTPTTFALTLADHHDAFESFSAPVFCDFVRNYSCTVNGVVVTLLINMTIMLHYVLTVSCYNKQFLI